MKTYTPVVLDALADCLRTLYWYKNDLRSFLIRAGVPKPVVNSLSWSGYKRSIIAELLDRLASNPASGMPILRRLVGAVVEQDEKFAHLAKLDDGRRKVADARTAVRHLKDLLGTRTVVERAEQARRENRTETERAAAELREREIVLAGLNNRFLAMCESKNPQRRGLDFQDLLRDLFRIYDLDPRGAFSRPGEQTDGSIRFEGTVLLVEARWTEAATSPGEVREFRSKVHDKLDSTLGLMISMGGFTDQAIESASSSGRLLVVLMDGLDVARVFQGVDDFCEVLRRKLRHAAEEGRAMYRSGGD